MGRRWLDELPRPDIVPSGWRRYQVRRRRALARRPSGPDVLHGRGDTRRLVVDVSVLSRTDAGTGIQRLVKAELLRLQATQEAGQLLCLAAATRRSRYQLTGDSASCDPAEMVPLELGAGDIFYGLDLCAHIIPRRLDELIGWRRNGAHFSFVIYDMLPLQHPEWFAGKLVAAFRRWIRAVAILADEVHCISADVQAQFHRWMAEHYGLDAVELPSKLLAVSVDGWSSGFAEPQAGNGRAHKTSPVAGPYCLAVGTIEPRKGYGPLLEAFEQLWRTGEEMSLVIVGRPGWKTAALQRRMRGHVQAGKRLFWFDAADDATLGALYAGCQAVLQPSLGEGLGLPMLEAASSGKPILARDLAVYRDIDVQGVPIHYFPRDADGAEMAIYIAEFIDSLAMAR